MHTFPGKIQCRRASAVSSLSDRLWGTLQQWRSLGSGEKGEKRQVTQYHVSKSPTEERGKEVSRSREHFNHHRQVGLKDSQGKAPGFPEAFLKFSVVSRKVSLEARGQRGKRGLEGEGQDGDHTFLGREGAEMRGASMSDSGQGVWWKRP